LWETWRSPAGERVRSFTIVTTTPNELWAGFHDRMPAAGPDELVKGAGAARGRSGEALAAVLGVKVGDIRVRDRPEYAKLCRRLTPKLPSTATVANGRNGW
jgi:hypothetical protein